jgi:hypothetical protein
MARKQYMGSLEQQMEEQREQIQRTLDWTTEDSDRGRKALEKLRSSLPSFPSRTPMWAAPVREDAPTEPIRSETPLAREESPPEAFRATVLVAAHVVYLSGRRTNSCGEL